MNIILEIIVIIILVTSGILEIVGGGVVIVLSGTLLVLWCALNKLAAREELVTPVREEPVRDELVTEKLNRSLVLLGLSIQDYSQQHEHEQEIVPETLTNDEM